MTNHPTDPAHEDRLYRQGVFGFLLLEARLATTHEIVSHMQAPCRNPDKQAMIRDATVRAIRDLAAMGILNIEGQTVFLSRAAFHTARLIEGPIPTLEPGDEACH